MSGGRTGSVDEETVFAMIADERRSLATTLLGLTPEQWALESLCAGWTVRDVGGHLIAPFTVPMWRFAVYMLRARGHFDTANQMMTRFCVDSNGERIPELLTANAENRFTPPGKGAGAPLVDIVVHGQDICIPAGIDRPIDTEVALAALDYITGPAATGLYGSVGTELRWEATDVDFTSGSGPLVRGPARSIILALTGRHGAAEGLEGDGVGLLD